jgi:hypothetical protein
MRRCLPTACLTGALCAVLVGCAADGVDVANSAVLSAPPSLQPAETTAPTPAPSSASPSTVAPTSTTTVTPEVRALELCSSPMSFVLGRVATPSLDEASGLVASRQHSDLLWAHNDGAEGAGLFALGTDGTDLGFHPVLLDGVVDVEDIALVSGPEGDDVLLADIGDNGANRPSIRLVRFAEPEPWAPAPIDDIEVLEFVYPDRAHNAEVLLVDDANRRIVIVTKEQRSIEGVPAELGPTAPSFIFEGPLDGHDGAPVVLSAVGVLDAPLLETRTVATTPHPASVLGIGGLPTGGDVSADGSLIVLRTYETIWVWPRLAGRSVAESLAGEPCQVQIAPEPQGEAIAVRGGSLITVSEGVNPDLFEVRP